MADWKSFNQPSGVSADLSYRQQLSAGQIFLPAFVSVTIDRDECQRIKKHTIYIARGDRSRRENNLSQVILYLEAQHANDASANMCN